jgi:hypothetical protein
MLRTLAKELPKFKDYGDHIVPATTIKILASQKLAKDCISTAGFFALLDKT